MFAKYGSVVELLQSMVRGVSSRNRHVAPIEGGVRGQLLPTVTQLNSTTHPPMHCLKTTFSLDNLRKSAFWVYTVHLKWTCIRIDVHTTIYWAFSALMSIYPAQLRVPTTHSRTLETLGAVTWRDGVLSCLLPPPRKDKYLWEVWKAKHNALHHEMPHAQCTRWDAWTTWQRL